MRKYFYHLLLIILFLSLNKLMLAESDPIYMDYDLIINDNTVLTDNIVFTVVGKGIIINADNIVLDGAGHSISTSIIGEGIGVKIYTKKNVTVKNLEIFNFEYGIAMRQSNACIIQGNNIHHNKGYNIDVRWGSNFNVFKDNIIAFAGDEGIHISGRYWQIYGPSRGNILMNNYFYENTVEHIYLLVTISTVIINNTIQGGGTGIYVKCSNDTVIKGNTFINTGVELRADVVYGEYYNVERTKIINNHFEWGGGIRLNSRATQVVDTVIIGNELINTGGIRLTGASRSNIMNNKIIGGRYGIRLERGTYAPYFTSIDNKIVNNEISGCTDSGIILMEGDQDYNEIISNKIVNNGKYGIYVADYASGNRFIGNMVKGNGILDLYDWSYGLENIWRANRYDTANW